jgi:hypothetical protein
MAVRTLTTCPTRIKAIVDVYAEAATAMKEAKEQMDLHKDEIRDYFLSIRADYDNPTSLKLKGNDRVLMCSQKNAWIFNQADIESIRELIPERVEEKTTYKLVGVNQQVVMSNPGLEEFIKPQAVSLSAK